jgi:hypothetical protein
MKKLYFETSKLFFEFIALCNKSSIKLKLPERTGSLHVIMIDDNLTNDEFLYNNGY